MIASSLPTAPLRAEHRELLPHIEDLRVAADAVGSVGPEILARTLADTYTFLTAQLVPHALAEDEVLYPAVARLAGTPVATATMSRDHAAVLKLVNELNALRPRAEADELDPRVATELRRVLYGLYALVKTHFAKEEEIYLPLLDERLTLAEAAELFTAMERAAARIKAAA